MAAAMATGVEVNPLLAAAHNVAMPTRAGRSGAAAPGFITKLACTVPDNIKAQMVEMERKHMTVERTFERNGDPFADYFTGDLKWHLNVHYQLSAGGNLQGFAVVGNDGRGKGFLYELHVHKDYRRRGIGRRLVELVAGSYRQLTLNVHQTNMDACLFYQEMGFGATGVSPDPGVHEMRWPALGGDV